MSEALLSETAAEQPRLIFFHSPQSGSCRKIDAFVAQVLQRRGNHGTFRLIRVDVTSREDLAERFKVTTVPTLLVVDGRRVSARLETPRTCKEIEVLLAPWLR